MLRRRKKHRDDGWSVTYRTDGPITADEQRRIIEGVASPLAVNAVRRSRCEQLVVAAAANGMLTYRFTISDAVLPESAGHSAALAEAFAALQELAELELTTDQAGTYATEVWFHHGDGTEARLWSP